MDPMCLPRRLRALPQRSPHVLDASTGRARLLGLAGLAEAAVPSELGLHLPRTRSVHTAGMRFALDLVWLGRDGAVVRVDRGVRPWRLRTCLAARSVIETRAVGTS